MYKSNGDERMAPECFIFMERLDVVYSPFNIPLQRNVQSMTSNVTAMKLVVGEYQQTKSESQEKSMHTQN